MKQDIIYFVCAIPALLILAFWLMKPVRAPRSFDKERRRRNRLRLPGDDLWIIAAMLLAPCATLPAQDTLEGGPYFTLSETPNQALQLLSEAPSWALWSYSVGLIIVGALLLWVICSWRYEAGWCRCYEELAPLAHRQVQAEHRASVTMAIIRGELKPAQLRQAQKLGDALEAQS